MLKKLFKNILLVTLIASYVIGLIIYLYNQKIGIYMKKQPDDIKLERFDDIWGLGYPDIVEKKFYEILPQAESLKDKSLYLQILSQIALAQALQKKFEQAHKTLNDAELILTAEYVLAQARILLERGRVFQQAEHIPEARSYFEQSFEVSEKNNLDYHAINAAHMIAIVAETIEEKIKWNQLALDLAHKTIDKRASLWLGSLYNNLGQNYLEEKQFEKALAVFKKPLEYRQEEKYAPNIRVAKWSVARTLRSLNHLDEALIMQNALLEEYAAITKSEHYDMPIEMFTLTRGWVYEEIAKIYHAKAIIFAQLAYEDLSDNDMFKTTSSHRLKRLEQIKHINDDCFCCI